jgi:radical SAM protein with 4Fe4S-binding SPASM domain
MVTFYSNQRGTKVDQKHEEDLSKYLLELYHKHKEFVSLPGYLSNFSKLGSANGVAPCYAGKNLFNIDSQGNVTRCIDRLDDVAGNIFVDNMNAILSKLNQQFESDACGTCWTSCRGSIETLMYGKKLQDYQAYYKMTKKMRISS